MTDWLLVELEPGTQKHGLLHLVTEDRVRMGKVLSVGPGRYDKKTGKQHSMDVQPGERVAFFRENLFHKPGEQITRTLKELGENLAMLRVIDVLLAVGDDTKVEFY